MRRAGTGLQDHVCVSPPRLTDPEAGPLIAVRLRVLTRKTLGGLHTDLQGECWEAAR